MKYMTANEAKTKFGEALDNCVREPVRITKHGRPAAVLVAYDDWEQQQQMQLEWLRAEVARGERAYEEGRYTEYDAAGLKNLFEKIKTEGSKRAAS